MRIYNLILMASALAEVSLRAQTPLITSPPASRVVWAGATVNFSVGISNEVSFWNGAPFSYQWLFYPASQTNAPVDLSSAATNTGSAGDCTIVNYLIHSIQPYPYGVAVDPVGDLYVSDLDNDYVFRISTNGSLGTFAGSGPDYEYSWPVQPLGDGSPANGAGLNHPKGLAADALGNVFIVDFGYNRVRKVDTNGIITTIAGGGVGDGGAATNAILSGPSGLLVDPAGNLLIADTANNRVRKLGTNGIITTIAGHGWPEYSYYIADVEDDFYHPAGLALDAAGNVFVALGAFIDPPLYSMSGDNITQVGTNASASVVAGLGVGNHGNHVNFTNPSGVAVDAGHFLYVADAGGSRIWKVDTNANATLFAGSTNLALGDGGAATNASLNGPTDVLFDPAGNLLIADSLHYRVRKVDTNGTITTVAGNGTGACAGDNGPATNASLSVSRLALGPQGDLFIADYANSRIRRMDTNGIITTVTGNALPGSVSGVAVDSVGNVYVADAQNDLIRKVAANNVISVVAGSGPFSYVISGGGFYGDGGLAASAVLNGPSAVAADGLGNVFIMDAGNHRLRKVDTNGIITTMAVNNTNGFPGDGGALSNASLVVDDGPGGLAADRSGNLYLVDDNRVHGGNRLRKVDVHGIITTVAGGGTDDPLSDGYGGAATNALLGISGATVDASGNLFLLGGPICEVTTDGVLHAVASPAPVAADCLAVDASDNLFFAGGDNLYGGAGGRLVGEAIPVTPVQGSLLTITNATVANAGSYVAVIGNGSYATQSQAAVLTVVTAPVISQSWVNLDGSVALNFVSPPGTTNEVLCANNLTPPVVWQPISTNVAGPDGTWTFTDTNAMVSPARFYRSSTH